MRELAPFLVSKFQRFSAVFFPVFYVCAARLSGAPEAPSPMGWTTPRRAWTGHPPRALISPLRKYLGCKNPEGHPGGLFGLCRQSLYRCGSEISWARNPKEEVSFVAALVISSFSDLLEERSAACEGGRLLAWWERWRRGL